jgi:hypothetical protein
MAASNITQSKQLLSYKIIHRQTEICERDLQLKGVFFQSWSLFFNALYQYEVELKLSERGSHNITII